jgi:predicted enzyme related to lactoylglutathione lyase
MSKFDANTITWFEIPTIDFNRASNFYEALLDKKLVPYPGTEPCALFPVGDGGVGGSLVQSAKRAPCDNGTIVFLNVDGQLDATLERAAKLHAKVILPRTEIPGGFGFYAYVRDSEGNQIGLHSRGA